MTASSTAQTLQCPACDSSSIDQSIEEFDGVCEECGVVIHDRSNPEPPRRSVEPLDTTVSEEKDWLSECRVRNATDKQLAQAFDAIETIADRLELADKIRLEAADLYCDGFREQITDGRNTTCVVGACLRLASIRCDRPIPVGRLVQVNGLDRRRFRLSRLALQEALSLECLTLEPRAYVLFLARECSLTEPQVQNVESILAVAEEEPSLVGKDPAGTAAAAVYLVGEYTQSEVSEAVGLSTETIRQRIKELQEVGVHA